MAGATGVLTALWGRRRSEAGGQEEPAPPEDGEEAGGEPGDISHEEDLEGSAPCHRWGGDRYRQSRVPRNTWGTPPPAPQPWRGGGGVPVTGEMPPTSFCPRPQTAGDRSRPPAPALGGRGAAGGVAAAALPALRPPQRDPRRAAAQAAPAPASDPRR